LTPELQAKLAHCATQQGRDADESRFLEAVEKGIAAAGP
jgi:hypothetical protein